MPLPEEPSGFYDPPGLGLPTVAHDRGHGITSVRVYCAASLVCAHCKAFSFDELGVPDDLPVIHIPRHRRFVCTACGSRKVTIRSEWPERTPAGPIPSMAGPRARFQTVRPCPG